MLNTALIGYDHKFAHCFQNHFNAPVQKTRRALDDQCTTHGIDLPQWMMGEDAVRSQASTGCYLRPIEAKKFEAAIIESALSAMGIVEGTACVYPTNFNETLSLFGTKNTAVVGGLAANKIETWRFADAAAVGDTEGRGYLQATIFGGGS